MTFIHYTKFKRADHGQCNICLKQAKLTWDHVPPKGGTELKSVEIVSLIQTLTNASGSARPFFSQNGVKYRTICKSCNDHLGLNFDSILNKFAIDLGRYLKSKLYLPPVARVETKPNSLIRAIVGHLLAANIDVVNTEFENQLRSFVFDENKNFPDFLSVFYWIYPYDKIEIIQDIIMPTKPRKYLALSKLKILKYFPIAYLITDTPEYEGLDSLNDFRNAKSTYSAEILIKLNAVKPQEWPNSVTDGNFVMFGQEGANSIKAQPRRK